MDSVEAQLLEDSVHRWFKECISRFPIGSKESIQAIAYTLAPGAVDETYEDVPAPGLPYAAITIGWRITHREKSRDLLGPFYVELCCGPCGFWSGNLACLPEELA